jgi:hypothetical protein
LTLLTFDESHRACLAVPWFWIGWISLKKSIEGEREKEKKAKSNKSTYISNRNQTKIIVIIIIIIIKKREKKYVNKINPKQKYFNFISGQRMSSQISIEIHIHVYKNDQRGHQA